MTTLNRRRNEFTRVEAVSRLFALNQRVRIAPRTGLLLSKDMQESLYSSDFEVIRLLPSGDRGFQYRIKNITSGQERVVVESDLSAAPDTAGDRLWK